MAKGEFINGRQVEREQEAYVDRITSDYSDAVGDLKYQHEINISPKQPGTIPYSGEVISTYDSRPINSLDFSYTAYPQWNITGAPPTALTLQTTYNVPGGYIGVLRGYRYEMDPVVPITYADLLMDIFADGVAQLGYQSLMHGQILTSYVPCFILINDGGTLTFQWRAPTGIGSLVGDVRHIIVEFYGNLILATGAPLTLEVANKEVGLPVKAQMGNTQLAGLEMNKNGRIQRPGTAYKSLTRSRYRGYRTIK